jgi:hypothetical protein
MGVKACMDSSMGEVSLHDIFLLFCFLFNGVEFNLLPFDVCEARVLCSQGVDIGDDPWVAEVE